MPTYNVQLSERQRKNISNADNISEFGLRMLSSLNLQSRDLQFIGNPPTGGSSTIFTQLHIDVMPPSGSDPEEVKMIWQDTDITFLTNYVPQVLNIELVSDEMFNGAPRFRFYDFKSTNNDLVVKVEHRIDGDEYLQRHPRSNPFRENCSEVVIYFQMSTHKDDKSAPFKFTLRVIDLATKAILDPDPQVGNDPP
jgi:hypothetical protein